LRALVGLLEHVVDEADPGAAIVVEVRDGEIEVRYLAETLDRESLGLSLADAVAPLHGGSLSAFAEGGEVRLVLLLGADVSTDAPEALDFVA
jgi:hypothetical protein